MTGTYDLLLVSLSVAVAIFASYVALDLAGRVTATVGGVRRAWLGGGSLAMGIGIWSMHFIGMLAFSMPGMPIAYDMPLWLLSVAIAIAASSLALFVASRPSVDGGALLLAGLVMGGAIAGMHYTGMAAMRIPGRIGYDSLLVTLSVAIAVVASLGAFRIAFRLRTRETRGGPRAKIAGGMGMGLAISGMHYTGMAATRITPTVGPLEVSGSHLLATDALAISVVIGTLVILALALGAVVLDRRLRARLEEAEAVRRSENRFRALVAATTQIVWVTDSRGLLLPDQTQWGAFTGQMPEEYRGWGWLDAVHPDDRGRTTEAWESAVETRTLYEVEQRVRHYDGLYRDFEVRAAPVLEPDGHVREWVGTHTDITERKRAQEERDFLAEATRALASSLDYETTLATVARLAVSRIADWCGVDLREGEAVRRVAVAHSDPAKEAVADELRRYPFDADAPGGSPEVIRTGRTVLYREIPDALIEAVARDPEQRRIVRTLGLRSAIVVPLIARGETLGAMSLVYAESGRSYGPQDLELAEELARRAALAVDHARLLRQTENARDALELLTTEMDLQMEELQNQAAQLEESQAELEMANDDLQRVNAEVTAAEAHYRRLVEASPYGVFVVDSEGHFTEVNQAGGQILGRSPREMLGGHFAELIAPEDLERARDAFTRVISGTDASLEVELGVERPSGERRLASVAITAIREDGRITGIHGVSRDITEERRIQEALQESEASYRMLFDSLTELVYIQDLKGRFLSVNEAVLRRYGYAREELLGRTPDLLVDPERTSLSAVQEHFERACMGEAQQFEFWARTAGGESFPEEVTLTRGRYFGQDVVIAVARDITDRMQAEEQRRESEERFRAVVESLGEGLLITDLNDRVQYANPRIKDLFGYAPEELVGRIAAEVLIPPEERDGFFRRMEERPRGISEAYEIPQLRKDGTRIWTEIHGSPLRDANGQVIGTVGAITDITDRKKAEEERLESARREQRIRAMELERARMSALFEQSPAFIALLRGPDHVFELSNPYYDRLMGHRDIIGKPFAQAFPELAEQGFLELLDRVYRTGEPYVSSGSRVLIQRQPSAEPEEHFVNLVYQPFRGQDGSVSGIFLHGVDVSDLVRVREEAKAANRAKSDFLSRMSHELRTPLNAILGFGQLMEMDVQTEENRESVDQILRAGQHLLALVDEVLDIARIEAGKMSLSVEPVSVRSVLQESVDLVRLTAAKLGITLRAQDALASEHFVQADSQRLKQVLLNLLSNAIKYNRSNGTVTLTCEEVGEERLCISVEDTGYGIPPEKLARLFTPFERLDAERRGVEGTGLGLTLSEGLVKAMGGTLGVESVEGEGSRFWIELSLAPRPAMAEPAREARQPEIPSEAAEATHTVLFVEDNLANVRLMERIFRRRPRLRLMTAMQGSLGLELAREHRPDLILLDLNLPDLSGDKVLLQLRQDPALRGIPVVMISGDAIRSQIQRLLEMGAQDYLTKPFNVPDLLRVIDENLQREER